MMLIGAGSGPEDVDSRTDVVHVARARAAVHTVLADDPALQFCGIGPDRVLAEPDGDDPDADVAPGEIPDDGFTLRLRWSDAQECGRLLCQRLAVTVHDADPDACSATAVEALMHRVGTVLGAAPAAPLVRVHPHGRADGAGPGAATAEFEIWSRHGRTAPRRPTPPDEGRGAPLTAPAASARRRA